jgi:hypothetical protein
MLQGQSGDGALCPDKRMKLVCRVLPPEVGTIPHRRNGFAMKVKENPPSFDGDIPFVTPSRTCNNIENWR